MQSIPLPHEVPLPRPVPGAHFWPACPNTVTGSQVSTPLHAFASSHAAWFAHENLQLSSQPVSAPLFGPQSQSSLPSLTPLPHEPSETHAPLLQTCPAPQLVPS